MVEVINNVEFDEVIIPQVTQHFTHVRLVVLINIGIVILSAWTRRGELMILSTAIFIWNVIDELGGIIQIKPSPYDLVLPSFKLLTKLHLS